MELTEQMETWLDEFAAGTKTSKDLPPVNGDAPQTTPAAKTQIAEPAGPASSQGHSANNAPAASQSSTPAAAVQQPSSQAVQQAQEPPPKRMRLSDRLKASTQGSA